MCKQQYKSLVKQQENEFVFSSLGHKETVQYNIKNVCVYTFTQRAERFIHLSPYTLLRNYILESAEIEANVYVLLTVCC